MTLCAPRCVCASVATRNSLTSRLSDYFATADTDGNGAIDRDELLNAFTALGMESPRLGESAVLRSPAIPEPTRRKLCRMLADKPALSAATATAIAEAASADNTERWTTTTAASEADADADADELATTTSSTATTASSVAAAAALEAAAPPVGPAAATEDEDPLALNFDEFCEVVEAGLTSCGIENDAARARWRTVRNAVIVGASFRRAHFVSPAAPAAQ